MWCLFILRNKKKNPRACGKQNWNSVSNNLKDIKCKIEYNNKVFFTIKIKLKVHFPNDAKLTALKGSGTQNPIFF